MVVPRLRSSHRIRQASGLSRPASETLTDFWRSFEPRDPREVVLRYRSAPWNDILDEPEDTSPQQPISDQPLGIDDVVDNDTTTTHAAKRTSVASYS
jgi:hypothetical protein